MYLLDFNIDLLVTGLVAGVVTFISWHMRQSLKTFLSFCWGCFFAPIGHNGTQQDALEKFYSGQASIYDATRKKLLQGREIMLSLAKSHLIRSNGLVWVDLGGGTGWNIEYMNTIMPLEKHFSAVHLVDLSPSLCKVAGERIKKLGLEKTVFVHCCDVNEFVLSGKKADFVSLSYSLSMIPNYFATVDKVCDMLDPKFGITGVVDFYTQSQSNYSTPTKISTLGGELWRHVPWLSRTFWRLWFEFDRVFLDPARRDYLEYRMGTIKSLNQRNNGLGFIPYYIWLGCDKLRAHDIEYRNQLAVESPVLLAYDRSGGDGLTSSTLEPESTPKSTGLEASIACAQQNLPFPSFFYQREIWRMFYAPAPTDVHFSNQFIYAFTWEDPRADQEILNLGSDDVVLAITSAGDNLLAYAALENPPRRIHGVDMNPCQGHLVELKLAAMKTLDYGKFWEMFGMGRSSTFENDLINKMAPHMSSQAFQWWFKRGPKIFRQGLYDHSGSTRWALRLARAVFTKAGLTSDVEMLCTKCHNLSDQVHLWRTRIRPALLESRWVRTIMCWPVFLWKALGVPINQAAQIESSLYEYIVDTLDPIVESSLISDDNYFYYLTLMGHYSRNNCPDYLSERGYFNLKRKNYAALDGMRIHTDSINNVVSRLTPHSVTVAVIMDHLDWFGREDGYEDVEAEVKMLTKALAPGGRVMLRSSAKRPWYIDIFEAHDYHCHAAAVRESGTFIDRVNMYASTWLCEKPGAIKELKI